MTENITLYDKNKNPKRFPIPTMGRLTEEGYEKYQAGESWPIKWDSSLIEIMMDIDAIAYNGCLGCQNGWPHEEGIHTPENKPLYTCLNTTIRP